MQEEYQIRKKICSILILANLLLIEHEKWLGIDVAHEIYQWMLYNIIANVDLESAINSYGMKNIRKASNDIYSEFTDINKIYSIYSCSLAIEKKNTPEINSRMVLVYVEVWLKWYFFLTQPCQAHKITAANCNNRPISANEVLRGKSYTKNI